jgi:hypothetical protein
LAIPNESLNKNFIVVQSDATIPTVRGRLAETKSNWTYVVVPLTKDRFGILRLADIITTLKLLAGEASSRALHFTMTAVLDAAPEYVAIALDQNATGQSEAQRLVKAAAQRRLVVTANDNVVGILAIESRSSSEPPDLAWLDKVWQSAPTASGARPPAPPQVIAPSASINHKPAEVALETARWINAEILEHPANEPLQIGEIYTLAFDVDTERRATSLVHDVFTYAFSSNEEMVDLTIQLSSSDFLIHTEPQKLKVPRTGKSKGRARFDVEPSHDGEGIINAVFLKDGNFIQLQTIKLNVGGPPAIESASLSRPLEAAFDVQPRDLGLVITNTGTSFKLIMTGPVYAEATLPLTLPQLDQVISSVRNALQKVVNFEAGPNRARAYQLNIDIPAEVHQVAFKHLAETGFLLFQQLFFGDAADAQARLLGDKLVEMAEKQRLKIQIVSQQFLLPWGLLYLAHEFDADNINAERFLGLKHIIEHIPLQPSMQVVDAVMNSQPNLTVSLNMNGDIDRQMGTALIGEQLNYWQQVSDRGVAKVLVRQNGEEVEKALSDATDNEQILYFYCHAISRGLDEGGGPDASSLQFAERAITLKDLKLRAPTRKPLPGAPLVFINACESAELSPLFYGGFVPYFMAKGARGVIGTECETPALFAREWAKRFFNRFLGGMPLGQVFLELRREFFFQHNNVMGLLYAVYCDGDTRVVPGIEIPDV